MNRKPRYLLVFAFLALFGLLFWIGQERLTVDSDITGAMPQADPVVAAAREILDHHPAMDNIYIDISQKAGAEGRDALAEAGAMVTAALKAGGLVEVVGEDALSNFMPRVLGEATDKLPLFFNQEALECDVLPRLKSEAVDDTLHEVYRGLFEMEAVGQSRYLNRDPLGLRYLVMARLADANPFEDAALYRGHIFTKDWNHLLIMAQPVHSGGNTAYGRSLREVLDNLAAEVGKIETPEGPLEMIYVGAFRAALDNEEIIKADTQKALVLVTIGLALLVFLGFRRPLIGLLAVVPAVCGLLLATFVYSLFKDTILAVALGFGGALISITVDHGLAYVLALDQPVETHGGRVSHDVWSVTSFTVYTTVAALLSLVLSGIPLFEEVGLFAALGVGLAAFSVHLLFPLLFPRLKGARRAPRAPMGRILTWLTETPGWKTLAAVTLLMVVMLFLARPTFNADLSAMNTVRRATLEAEETLSSHWGQVSGRIYLLARGRTFRELWPKGEDLARFLDREKVAGSIDRGTARLAVFPPPEVQKENLAAWREFWQAGRGEALRKEIDGIGQGLGFSKDAFDPFFQSLNNPEPGPVEIPESIYTPLGISRDKQGEWLLLETVVPGDRYDAEGFFDRAHGEGFAVFDAQLFSTHLAGYLNRAFVKMLGFITLAATVLLFFLFVDWKLVLLALAPLAFSLVCTLGTLKLLGHPLSIPSLMLAPVVVGLGLDYGLYLVRSRQRFGVDNPGAEAFQAAILLGGLSTLVGMGSLALSEHQVLKSAGLSTFLGIGYAMIGTFTILPPFIRLLFAPRPFPIFSGAPGSSGHAAATLARYRLVEPLPRQFARYKMKLDPMFSRLADFVKPGWTVIDLGCGYGIPAAWLLTIHPDLVFHSLDPDPNRTRVAARALGSNADVRTGMAQDISTFFSTKADAALMLDMAHYLNDEDLFQVLAELHRGLHPGGRLIMRTTIPQDDKKPYWRWLEIFRMKISRCRPHYRTRERAVEMIEKAGFHLDIEASTAPGREEVWFVAERRNG